MESGEIKQIGTYDELSSSGINLDLFAASDEENLDKTVERCNSISESHDYFKTMSVVSKKSVASSFSRDLDSSALNLDLIPTNLTQEYEDNQEKRTFGALSWKNFFEYFRVGGGFIGAVLTLFMFVFSQSLVVAADYWVSTW